MQLMVYDDRHRAGVACEGSALAALVGRGAGCLDGSPSPERSSPIARASEWTELRYHHLVPSPRSGKRSAPGDVRRRRPGSTLITDYYSYNTDLAAVTRRTRVAPPEPGSSRTGSAT